MFGFLKKVRRERKPLTSFAVLFFAYNRDVVIGAPPLTDAGSKSYALSLSPLRNKKANRQVPLTGNGPSVEKGHSASASEFSAES